VKTTIEIADSLLKRAQREARRQGRTLRSLVEEGLERTLAAAERSEPYKLPDCSVGRSGGTNPLAALSWHELRDEIYGGR
jgi:hypothetical protein